MPTDIVGEGDIDRAIIESFSIVPEDRVLPRRGSSHNGRDSAIRTAANLCLTVDQKTIALVLDLNGSQQKQIEEEAQKVCEVVWTSSGSRTGSYLQHGKGRIRLVTVGFPSHPVIQSLGFKKYSIDDYLVCLSQDKETLDAFRAACSRDGAKGKSHQDILKAVSAAIRTLDVAGFPIDSSKRYLDILRAVLSFGGARATFAKSLISAASPEIRNAVLGDLQRAIATDP